MPVLETGRHREGMVGTCQRNKKTPCHELFGVECEIRVRVRVSVAERKAEWL